MADCIFCKIVNSEIPSYKIYEDGKTLAFLDTARDVDAHVLVIPKKHFVNTLDADEEDFLAVMKSVKKIASHLVENCGFAGVSIVNSNGKASGQTVFHLHYHLLPCTEGMKGFLFLKKEAKLPLEEVQKKIAIN